MSGSLLDIGAGLQGIGTALGAFGKISAGNAAYAAGVGKQQASDYEAAVLQQRATQAMASGASKAQIARLNGQYVLSSQRANAAASGGTATSTTAVSTMGQTSARVDYDAMNSIYSAKDEALGYQNQAALDVYMGQQEASAGKSEQTGSIIGAASSVLGSAGNFAARYGSENGYRGTPSNSGYE